MVVVTELEHHANFVPWQQIALRTGAEFRAIPFDGNGELALESLDEIARAGQVKVVAANWISNTLGTINPIEKLTAWAHEQGAIMVVDAAQAVPHRAVDVQALGCDFLGFTSHKLCGPGGAGALWGRRELLERMPPFEMGGEMIRSVSVEKTTWNDLPYKFEAGTPAIAEAYGMGIAIDYITGVGLDAIEEYEHELAVYAMERLGELPFVTVYGPPPERHAGIVSFDVAGRPPARRRSDPRLGRCRDPRRSSLHAAARHAARRGGDQPRELLPVLAARGGRPARRGRQEGEGGARLSEFEQLYREVILDHYKAPRNHGLLEPNDAVAEGQNPLCGDEIIVSVRFGAGDVIEDVGFEGRGCAISQAATSMLTDLVKGRTATEVATMPKDELLEEIGIPLTPVRLKCALLGLGVLKVALHKAKGTPLPEEWGTASAEISVT